LAQGINNNMLEQEQGGVTHISPFNANPIPFVQANKIKNTQNLLSHLITDTYNQHIHPDAPASVAIDPKYRHDIESKIKQVLNVLEQCHLFEGPQKQVLDRMYRESFPNFLKLQLVFQAQKALGRGATDTAESARR
jgi:hypothetical protein